MSRLTNSHKQTIVDRATTHALKDRKEALSVLEDKLAIECYNKVFPKKLRDTLKTVPEGWLRMDRDLRFNVGGWDLRLNTTEEYPIPMNKYYSILGVITDEELVTKVQACVQEKKTLDEEDNALTRKMQGFLSGFTSFKQLRESWPEGADFYKDLDVERVAQNMPAVIVQDINKVLGLK